MNLEDLKIDLDELTKYKPLDKWVISPNYSNLEIIIKKHNDLVNYLEERDEHTRNL